MAVWIPYWDLRCEKCSDGQKEFNGCEKDTIIPDRWRVRELNWTRCPVKLITMQSIQYIQAYEYMQLGLIPHGTGWRYEQNKFIEAMRIIGTEIKRIPKPDGR